MGGSFSAIQVKYQEKLEDPSLPSMDDPLLSSCPPPPYRPPFASDPPPSTGPTETAPLRPDHHFCPVEINRGDRVLQAPMIQVIRTDGPDLFSGPGPWKK